MERIEAADYHELRTPSSPRLGPDGEQIAYVRSQAVDDETTEGTIDVVPVADGDRQRFSLAEGTDAEPRWSPSGDRIAFTSTRGADDDRQQLWVVPTDGGEGKQVTDVVGGVSSIAWSPDGRQIAFVQRVTEEDREEDRDRAVPEEYEPEDPDPRVIERTVYRSMEQYIHEHWAHIYLVDLEHDGEAGDPDAITRVTDGDCQANAPTWTDPDTLYYTDAWVGDDPDDSLEFDILRHDLEAEEPERMHRSTGWGASIAVTSDGRVAFPYTEPDRASMQQVELEVYDPATETVTTLTRDLDRTIWGHAEPAWGPEERKLYFATPDEGEVTLWQVPGDGSEAPQSLFSDGAITGLDVGENPDGTLIMSVTMSQWDHPGDVFVHRDGDLDRRTRLNEAYLDEVEVQQPEPLTVSSSQGEVEGWVLTPPEFDPAETYPLIVEIHGGPHTMWTTTGSMWHEFQTLAARGYVVFWSNPRGSAGYGESYMQAIERDWGQVTWTDVAAGVEAVSARDYVDEEAMYLTGGSFGGFMTSWTVSETDRFDAAVAQRGVYDLTGFYGSTDGAYKLVEGDFDATPSEDYTFLWEQSPVSRAHEVDTPTLVLHSELDYRTPIASAELFYRILRKHDVDTRFVRYPREGHELSRSGEPGHIVDRLERIARWFDGYSPYHDVPPALERPSEEGLSTPSENDE